MVSSGVFYQYHYYKYCRRNVLRGRRQQYSAGHQAAGDCHGDAYTYAGSHARNPEYHPPGGGSGEH
jgi:hypothetical protein